MPYKRKSYSKRQPKQARAKVNMPRFAMMGALYSVSLCVFALGLAVCLIKSPQSIAQDYMSMAALYENQMGDQLHVLPSSQLMGHITAQEKLVRSAYALDPYNQNITDKLEALQILKDQVRTPEALLWRTSAAEPDLSLEYLQ